ncbi:MAG TPA: hypothetical protein VKR27_02000 [Acidimicrobiales bacterium]|nr:hypothetical protein [Acidimicrobiales bacterium]
MRCLPTSGAVCSLLSDARAFGPASSRGAGRARGDRGRSVLLHRWEWLVKKGRHRRFEEARSLKRAIEVIVEPCPECGAGPEEDHAAWCLYESDELEPADEDAELN